MKRFRARLPGKPWVTIVTSLALTVVVAADRPVQAASIADPLLRATPLILKDGRIANVSVHVVPFAAGKTELAADVAEQLSSLTRAVGTDCFLTAQVIGHIQSSEVAEDDTLNAHRLARSRADAVQASLIGSGLPAKAIASVWDWQFMVREARATLWVFQLTRGEDCEGRPLRPDLVAQGQSQEPPTIVSAAAPAERAPTPAAQPAATPVPVEEPPAAQPAPTPAPAEPTATATATAPATVAAVPDDAAPTPRPTLKPAASKGEVATKTNGKAGGAGTLVITFPTNSSYFPPDTPEELRMLVDGLEDDRPHQVVLQAAVSGSDQVVGATSPEEAARYNRWMAERRLERVQDWLVDNLGAGKVVIKPEYLADDDTRRVVVRIGAAG